MAKKAKEIVITGGPGGGKTRALAFLARRLKDREFRVFTVPEMATLIIANGVSDISLLGESHAEKYLEVEEQMLRLHLAMRNIFIDLSEIFPGEKRVIIYDRAAMDMAAYMPRIKFEKLMEKIGLHRGVLLNNYHAVFHMVTAARGAEKFYGTAGNSARREKTIEGARRADERTFEAWRGHPCLKVIDNSTGFDEKLERLWIGICEVLGIPSCPKSL